MRPQAKTVLAAAAAAALMTAGARTASAQDQSVFADPDGNGTLTEYRLNTTPLTFFDANAAAQAAGANLASAANAAENAAINAAARGDAWIGLTDNETFGGTEAGSNPNGGFVWTDGTPFTYQNFGAGEPNDFGAGGPNTPPGEDAVHIRADGMWNDHNAGAELGQGEQTFHYVTEHATAMTAATAPLWRLRQFDRADNTDPGAPPNSFGPGGIVEQTIAGDATPREVFVNTINLSDDAGGAAGRTPGDNSVPGDNLDRFVLEGTGFLEVGAGEGGTYSFLANTDDGVEFAIDTNQDGDFNDPGEVVVLDDAFQPPEDSAIGTATLAEGFYAVRYRAFEGTGGSSFELYAAAGALTGFGPEFTLLGSDAGALDVVQAIPEPATLSLLALSGLGALARRRRA